MTHPALIERITRSLAYMLRHQPEQFDLELDEYGYAELDDVVQALNERLGEAVDPEDVREAIESGDRIRYEIKQNRIRALYGHSIDVKAGEPSKPPELLYVGVSRQDAERALRFGLRAGRRRYLHLALRAEDALETVQRTTDDFALLTIHALDAWEEGVNFFDRGALFLSDPIPTQYLQIDESVRAPRAPREPRGPERGGHRGEGRRPAAPEGGGWSSPGDEEMPAGREDDAYDGAEPVETGHAAEGGEGEAFGAEDRAPAGTSAGTAGPGADGERGGRRRGRRGRRGRGGDRPAEFAAPVAHEGDEEHFHDEPPRESMPQREIQPSRQPNVPRSGSGNFERGGADRGGYEHAGHDRGGPTQGGPPRSDRHTGRHSGGPSRSEGQPAGFGGGGRGEPRGTFRGDDRSAPRGEFRGENRGAQTPAHGRGETHGGGGRGPRSFERDRGPEQRPASGGDDRGGRGDTRGPRDEHRAPRGEPRGEFRGEGRGEHRPEHRPENRPEHRPDRPEHRPEHHPEHRAGSPRDEYRGPRDEPQAPRGGFDEPRGRRDERRGPPDGFRGGRDEPRREQEPRRDHERSREQERGPAPARPSRASSADEGGGFGGGVFEAPAGHATPAAQARRESAPTPAAQAPVPSAPRPAPRAREPERQNEDSGSGFGAGL